MRACFAKFGLILGMIFSMLILGCSTDTLRPAVTEIESASKEFNFNYRFLYYRYYLSAEELAKPAVYLESPDTAKFAKYSDVADVFVMYGYMSDRMTTYYPHAFFNQLHSSLTQSSQSKSFGMELDSDLFVKTVYREGPANSAGIRRGDRILALDSVSLGGDSALYAKTLSAKSSDTFLFTILSGRDTSDVSLTRAALLSPTVYLDSVGEIPVIRITGFTDQTNGFSSNGTAKEFKEALVETEGAASTVLDLRSNPGGLIDICTQMAAALLSEGDTVILEMSWHARKGRRDSTGTVLVASEDGIGKGRYYVLMLDSNSASCSEIFAAGVTANLKSPIVGTNSFGKGIGQTYTVTPDSGYGVATSYLFFDKEGNSYHGYGFAPDFPVADPDSALALAAELATARTAKRTAGYSTEVQPFWRVAKKSSGEISPEKSLAEFKRGMAVRESDCCQESEF